MVTSPTDDYWFVESEEPHYDEYTAKAKEVCSTCEVRLDCADYAIALKEEHGIWGGMTFEERRVYARRKKRAIKKTNLLAQERERERLSGLDAPALSPRRAN